MQVKVSHGVKKGEIDLFWKGKIDLFWCIFSELSQTDNFSDLTRQRQELCAENTKKHQNLGN